MLKNAVVAAAIFFAVLGCKHAPSLVGKWTAIGTNPGAVEFSPTGDITIEVRTKDAFTKLTGLYTVDGTTLTTSIKNADVQAYDPKVQAMLSQHPELKARMEQTNTCTLKWVNDDTVNMPMGNNVLTLTRNK